MAVPPRPAGADAGHQRGRPAAAAGLDRVGGPGATPASRRTSRPGRRCDPSVPHGRRSSTRRSAPTTALAFEARDGHVHVFLPPTERLEDYADLLKLVEVAAREARRAGRARGLRPAAGPAADPARRSPPTPASSRSTCSRRRAGPSSATSPPRCTTRPGRAGLRPRSSTSTGCTPAPAAATTSPSAAPQPVDSPLLRRPDLLVSLITYWQRHPALSYLFSGRFIGPTSQAPRFDEGRPEAVYEMEIAFAEIAPADRRAPSRGRAAAVAGRPGAAAPAHRPDRQHPPRRVLHRQALQPRLLARPARPARAARLRDAAAPADGAGPGAAGAQPGRDVLGAAAARRRWCGGAPRLHEDFLLPQGATADIGEVVADLRALGIAFEESWLDPFTEFRFPRIGVTRLGGGIELELRQAVEPWHVLGEEATAGGTARYVDSSVERLQVSVRGIDPERHLVTCQGVPVPLTPTGAPGEHYAGVRYRAWQPWSALHPSIEVHAPLRFEVVDIGQRDAASAARPTTSCTRAAAPTTTRRSTPTRPRPAGPAGSSRSATPPGGSTSPRCGRPAAGPRQRGLPAHPRPAAGARRASSVTRSSGTTRPRSRSRPCRR